MCDGRRDLRIGRLSVSHREVSAGTRTRTTTRRESNDHEGETPVPRRQLHPSLGSVPHSKATRRLGGGRDSAVDAGAGEGVVIVIVFVMTLFVIR